MTRNEITIIINQRVSDTFQRNLFEQIFDELFKKFGEPEYDSSWDWFLFSNRKYRFNFAHYPRNWCYLDYYETREYILSWNYVWDKDSCSNFEGFLEKLKGI